jgi:hypothetical protein
MASEEKRELIVTFNLLDYLITCNAKNAVLKKKEEKESFDHLLIHFIVY